MYKYLFFSFIMILLLSSCNRNRDRIELPFTVWAEIPAGLNTIYTHHFPIEVPTFGSVPANIIDAQPAAIRLTMEDGLSNFDFARRIYLDLVTDSSRMEMGFNLEVPLNNSSTADLLPSILNMKDYIQEEAFDVELKMEFRGISNTTSRVRIDFTLLCSVDR